MNDKKVEMLTREEIEALSLDEWEEVMLEAEKLGYYERVRDEHGIVKMRPDSTGKLRVVWRRTDRPHPSRAH